jgi:CheY-like chemotaxis protein
LPTPNFQGSGGKLTTKLLAIDDSKTMRRVLEITFSGEEFHTTILGSAEEALAAVRSNPPHVALVDGHLGASSSGYELCRAIKQVAPATRVIILSSKQRPYDEGAGASVGADGSFDKPFDSTKMIAKVAEEAAHAGPVAAAAPPASSIAARPEPPRPVAPVPMQAPPEPAMRPASAPAAMGSVAARRPQAPAPIASAAPPRATISNPQSTPHAAPVVALSTAATAGLAGKLEGLGLTRDQVAAVLSLSREVVEQAVWEVVPVLAETLIKEEIARLAARA